MLPELILYSLFALALILLQLLLLWMEGGLLDPALVPLIVFNGLLTPFTFALIRFLDVQAGRALESMRPSLELADPALAILRFRLTNMPTGAPLLFGGLLLAFAVLMESLWITPLRYAALDQLPLFSIAFHIVDKSSAFLFGVFAYHTIRQLRLVNTIHRSRLRISLFQLEPTRAFSVVTASTAAGMVVGAYGWLVLNPELLSDPVTVGFLGLVSLTALVVFVWPLMGVHGLMEAEKEGWLKKIDQEFERVFSDFNRGLRDDDYSSLARLNGTIASLEIQRNRIASIPTWPWKPETARFALTTIALPLLFAVLRFLVERAFDL